MKSMEVLVLISEDGGFSRYGSISERTEGELGSIELRKN